MKACRDCVHLEGGIKNTAHACTAPENREMNLVTGEGEFSRTPEVLRSRWNVAEGGCGPEGKWFKDRQW